MCGAHYHVYPSFRGVRFYVYIISRQGEDDVKHLLVIPFVIGIVGIRHGGKESLELSSGTGYTRKQKEDASQHPLSLLTHRHLHFIKR